MNWKSVYQWEVVVNGKIIKQFPTDLSMEKVLKRYGKVDVLSLVPQKAGFHRFDIVIPSGALPIYSREINISNVGGSYTKFKIGWSAGGICVANLINAKTGNIELKVTK